MDDYELKCAVDKMVGDGCDASEMASKLNVSKSEIINVCKYLELRGYVRAVRFLGSPDSKVFPNNRTGSFCFDESEKPKITKVIQENHVSGIGIFGGQVSGNTFTYSQNNGVSADQEKEIAKLIEDIKSTISTAEKTKKSEGFFRKLASTASVESVKACAVAVTNALIHLLQER